MKNKIGFGVLALSSIILSLFTLVGSDSNAAKSKKAVEAAPSVGWEANVDQLIRARDFKKANQAIDLELSQKSLDPARDFNGKWRKSRVEIFLGDEAKDDSKKQEHYQNALKLAEEAILVNSNHGQGYLRKAAAAGKVALFKGILEAREYVAQVRDSASMAIEKSQNDPEVLATAHYILGRTHLKLSDTPFVIRKPIGLGWGNVSEAEKNILKATELKPDSVLFWTEAAKLYKKLKKADEFKKAVDKAKSLPEVEPSDRDAKRELESLSF
jgi:tetratricopeptide (TPR) repeat protein